MSWPPALAMLATTLPHSLTAEQTARVLSILGAHGCSTIGELPAKPREIVHGILREARRRNETGPAAAFGRI
jgi:hypothetical protein